VPLTYALLLMQYNKDDLNEFIKVIPISAIMMIMLCVILKYIPLFRDWVYLSNGRLSGFFQYSNTFALFLLIGIIILVEYDTSKIKKYIGIAILLMGIYATGSRTIFLFTIFNFIIFIIKYKKIRKYLILLFVISILTTTIYALISRDFDTVGRYLTIATNSNTLTERILYYKDALSVIPQNIFGLGYRGYAYIQPSIQTGIYSSVYVHNDVLQLALDIGIIPTIIMIISIIKSLSENGIKPFNTKKQILLTIFLHSLIDFNLQFMYIFLIFVMTLNIFSGKKYILSIKKNIAVILTVIPIILVYLYFGVCTFLQYINKNGLALKMYPIYTKINLKIMKENVNNNIEYSNKIANKVLETNEHIKSVYDVKSLYYMERNLWDLMVYNKQKSMEIGKYEIGNYEEYILMLSKAIDYYARMNNMTEVNKYIELVCNVPLKIESVKNNTARISYNLRKKPDFELSRGIEDYIQKIKGVLNND